MPDNIFSFSNWFESNNNAYLLFSTSKRNHLHDSKLNIAVSRSFEIPTYHQFVEINKLFMDYVPKCPDPNVFMKQFLKIELAGAKVTIKNKEFIIVEERKNSIVTISEDNRKKTHIKAGLKMIFEYNKVKYCVLGNNLKINRFYKK